MTHLNNLAAILDAGELLCKNELNLVGATFNNIANSDVQDKRAKITVPLNYGGTLHDYVPFYFWGTTPMLLVNKKQQENIIFLVSKTDIILDSGISFVFTDRHAVIQYAKFYDNLDELNKLDWEIIEKRYWGESDDSREKKQAEFLIYKKLPFNYIYGIAVANNDVIENVTAILGGCEHQPIVKVKKEWYFS